MNSAFDNLTSQLRLAEAATAPPASSPQRHARLDAEELLQTANRRRRKRSAARSLTAAGCALLVCFGVAQFVSQSSVQQQGTVELAALTVELQSLSAQTDALLTKLQLREAELQSSLIDLQLVALQELVDETPSQQQLESEAFTLESAPVSEELAWEIEWSKSAALRLELARQDAEHDPALATEKYRQIASTYAGTRWGDEARLALAANPL